MNNNLIKQIADYIGFSEEEVLDLAYIAKKTYVRYKIPKKNGGKRLIHHPSRKTKTLQYAIMDCLLRNLSVHICAIGYRKGISSPLLKNAQLHANYSYTVRIDINDFFPSIKPNDLLLLDQIVALNLSPLECEFLVNALFIKVKNNCKGLAIGAPSSPMISNAVLFSFDQYVHNIASNLFGIYTRYADDLVFSTNNKGNCYLFLQQVRELLNRTNNPNLKINENKTLFMSNSCRRMVTGLIINNNNIVSISKENRDKVKHLVYSYTKSNITDKELTYLRGYLAFVRDVDSKFLIYLNKKYTQAVIDTIIR